MSDNPDAPDLGKKIFFLNPPAVILNRVIMDLAQEEYEVYAAKNELKLKAVLRKHPDSIVFVNISENMKENTCEEWIRKIMKDSATQNVSIGVISLAENEEDRQKYIDELKVKCGYTPIKSDITKFYKKIVTILNNMSAKGRRKYIRLPTEKEANTTVNLPMNGSFINGQVKDISAVGFSCFFAQDPDLKKNELFHGIQIRLHTQLLNADGIAFGYRMDRKEKTYVMLFTQRADSEIRFKIRKFIHNILQSRMDFELN